MLLFSQPAQATLVGADLFATDDQMLTRDTATGLGWLDLNLTLNLSVNDILGGSGGYLDSGFRHATENEITVLFTNAGIPRLNTNATTPDGDPAGRVTENYDGVVFLMGLLGCTGNCVTGGPDFTSGFAALSELEAQAASMDVWDGKARALVGNCCAGFDSRHPSMGHWLVRQVPEPTTFAIFALGLLGLGFSRRKRAA